MKLQLLLYYYLLLIVVANMSSCSLGQLSVQVTATNSGSILAGDSTANSAEIEARQEVSGDTLLTPEQQAAAKKGYQEGKDFILKSQANLDFIAGQIELEYKSNISRAEYKDKFPIFVEQRAHRDLVTVQHITYKVFPKFKPRSGGLARSKARQREHVKAGRSQTMNSRHLTDPVQGVDVVSTRGYFPDRQGENVDAEAHGFMHGFQFALGQILDKYPCEYFASKVENVFFWTSLRDLFHRQVDPKDECKENYHEYVET